MQINLEKLAEMLAEQEIFAKLAKYAEQAASCCSV